MELGILHGTTWYQATLNAGMYNETGGVISQDTSLVNDCLQSYRRGFVEIGQENTDQTPTSEPPVHKGATFSVSSPKDHTFFSGPTCLEI